MSEPFWQKVEDGLPEALTVYNDGSTYHGVVECWFAQCSMFNLQKAELWSSSSMEPYRWLVNGVEIEPGPTHWRHLPGEPPE